MHSISLVKTWLTIIVLSVVVACSPAQQVEQQTQLNGNTMGTYYVVKFYSKAAVDQTGLQQAIDKALEQINDLMSTYRPDSELMRFNRHASSESFALSEQSRIVIAEALRLAEQTDGVLDITVGPLTELWGFGARGRVEQAPSDEDLAAARALVGYNKLTLAGNQLTKSVAGLAVDLSTIAKGYGVDQVASILQDYGIENFLVEIGGEMRIKGEKPGAAPWKIAIEKPVNAERAVQRILQTGDMGVATSGDYRNYFEQDGVRYSHLLDPRTGKPIQHRTVSVTVLHPSCMTADGYATALNVMAADEALAFANRYNIAALIVVKTDDGFTELASDAFKPFLTE